MENSVRKTDVSEISTKSKSLDVQSLYVEKSRVSKERGERKSKTLKRKRRSSVENRELSSGKGENLKKEQKSPKEVELSSFERVSKKRIEGSNAVDVVKISSVKKNDAHVTANGNSKNSNSLNNISVKLEDNAIPIPKRPRGFSRRKKHQNDHVSDDAGTSRNVISDAQVVKLTDESVATPVYAKGKRKQHFDEVKESSSSKANSVRHLKTENGASVGYIGDSTKKRDRRKRGKGRESEPRDRNPVEEFEHSDDNSAHTTHLHDDEEDNLEQNAARMLSSRFDPSCTGFSGNRSASTSMNDCSLTPSSGVVASPRGNHSAGSESNSADAAGRVLRPRKQHKEKGHVRRRRHFYELFFRDLDAYWVLNRRIKVYWPLDKSWYFGLVNNYDPERKLHHVKYDDRDEEWINLQNERFKLLLLPSEVPRKSPSGNTGVGGKHVDGEGHVDAEEDDCLGSFMESEPIISWLARSNHRVKSSPLGIRKRQKTSVVSKNLPSPMFSDDTVATTPDCMVAGSSGTYANHLSGGPVTPKRSSNGNMAKKPVMDHTTRSKDGKLPLVYFRRRFRKKGHGICCISNESSWCRSAVGSDTSLASVVDKVGLLEESDTALRCSGPDPDMTFWTGMNLSLLRFTVPMMDLDKVRLALRISLQWDHNVTFGAQNFWIHQLLLLHHGILTTVGPKVRLEMLFVDNVVGLRFMLFEGCMMQAVSLVCLVLALFHQPNGYEKLVDLQLPVTSIRFKFSGFPSLERHLVFVSYNFLELVNSKWQYLDGKLKRYCSVTKQLPLTECTFDNIKVIQNRNNQLPVPSVSGAPVALEGSRRRFKQGIMHMGFSKAFANISTGLTASNSDKKHRRFPPFVLSFAAAPSFFVSLHLKLLMEKNVASISFQNCHPRSLVEDPENCGRFIGDDLSPVEELGDQVKSKVEIDALSISSGGNWTRSSQNCINGEHNVTGNSVGCQDNCMQKNDAMANPERRPHNHPESEQCAGGSRPSVSDDHSSLEKSEGGHFSHFNGISVQIPPDDQFETQSLDRGRQNAQQSMSNLVWHVNDSTIRSPNPTAPRSIWHRNRNNCGSSSFGGRSNLWPDGRGDLIGNGFANGSKKPRTQISYMLPFGGSDFSSKPRSHHRKGRPYKKMRNENEKMTSGGSKTPQRYPELLSCDANVLITEGDRGWRECGAEVVLEFVDHKDWRLLVKLSGVTKYSYKPYQFLQPGSTNRHTHAMMWKGGKDWILEFPDRSQWARFKEMHEECYNRNIRVASVKTIPIPGVRMIEENDDVPVKLPIDRTAPKYHRQVESDVERALNPSHVVYDMDSDDENWLHGQRSSSETRINNLSEISEEMFERTMNMFESIAYDEERDDFTVDDIEEIMVEIGPIDVIKTIHEHWRQKRQRIRLPLIRHLQPPAWERYQQQVREWEIAMSKIHNFPNGCKEGAVPLEKPAMFAFCLRPRGLEVPNRGLKQRSQRKLGPGGHNYVLSRDQDGLHILGRKSNGFEDRGVVIGHNHDYSDASPWPQTSTRILSPRDAVGSGYLSMSSDGSEMNQHQTFSRNKSKKMRTVLSPTDSQMMAMSYNQRTGMRNGMSRWNPGLSEWSYRKHYQAEGFQRLRVEQLDDSDIDEFRLRDASGAAQHASNMAKLKREKAQRLLYKADLAIHKATVALMIAEAIKASSEEELAEEG